jgi:perosamine synthetase
LKWKIPYANPYIDEEDVEAVAKAVREKRLSQGEYVETFERKFADYLGCDYALATMNGTSALHLAVCALGLGKGDEVIVPSFTFVASANCILYVGAKPIFVDIDEKSLNMDPAKVEEVVSKKTKAIIVVHYGGQTADMDPILEIAGNKGIHVIEDASEAHGATYKGREAGSMGDVSCFSFYPNKNMTTGEGGMLVTSNKQVAEKARILRSHGQDSRFHHIMLGFNYKMMDMQAALGLVQFKRLNQVIQMKKEAAAYYDFLLSGIDEIELPYVMPNASHTYMFYTIKLKGESIRDRIKQHLADLYVETTIAFPPVHLQPFYKSMFGYKEGDLPVTEECAKRVLSLPMYSHLQREDQQFIVKSIKEVL